jgi:hypothetical protein
MAGKIVTIFCCGTSYDASARGETVADLHRDATGYDLKNWTPGDRASVVNEERFKLVVDGPASAARFRNMSGSLGTRLGRRVFEALLGLGLDQTAEDVVNGLYSLHRCVGLDRIIMTGWSRGGILCHAIANELLREEKLKTIPVTIVAIDPVPGPLNSVVSDFYDIPANVSAYYSFLMENEHSRGMDPIKVRIGDKVTTNKQIILMPGLHQDGVLDRRNVHGLSVLPDHQRTTRNRGVLVRPVYPGLDAVNIMVDYLTGWILQTYGTTFKAARRDRINALFADRIEQIALYSDMIIDTQRLFDRGKGPLQRDEDLRTKKSGAERTSAPIRNHLLVGAGYFINELHECVFRAEFSSTYDAFFADKEAVHKFRRFTRKLDTGSPDAAPRTGDASRRDARVKIEDVYRVVCEIGVDRAVMSDLRRMSRQSELLEIYDSLTRFRYWTGARKGDVKDSFDQLGLELTEKFEQYPYGSFHKRAETAETFVKREGTTPLVPWRA